MAPRIWCWDYLQASYENHLSESDFGKMLGHPSAPNALPKSPSLPALAPVDVGTVSPPYPCGNLVNSGEAAAASSAGWKWDGSSGALQASAASSPGGMVV